MLFVLGVCSGRALLNWSFLLIGLIGSIENEKEENPLRLKRLNSLASIRGYLGSKK